MPLLGWAAANALSGGSDNATADTSRSDDIGTASRDATATPGSFEIAQAARTAIDVCATRLAAGDEYIAAAGIGIGHWHEHVQARTDMLDGAVSEQQMRDIWRRTRLAGPEDVSRATAALEAYQALPPCEEVAGLDGPDTLTDRAAGCVERATRMETAVTAATAGISDWANHLNAMAAHADGDMDSTEAQGLWVAAWEAAPTNIGAFDDARDQLAQAPRCA